jgi:hypothetical protein
MTDIAWDAVEKMVGHRSKSPMNAVRCSAMTLLKKRSSTSMPKLERTKSKSTCADHAAECVERSDLDRPPTRDATNSPAARTLSR